MSLLRAAFGREQRTQQFGDSSIPSPTGGWGTVAGVAVTEASALSIPTVLACVRTLSDDASMLPLDSYKKTSAGTRVEVYPAPQIVAEPFGTLDPQVGFQQMFVSYWFRGRALAWITDTDPLYGLPTSLLPLHPDTVRRQQDPQTGYLETRINGELVPNDRVLHIPNMMLPGAIDGVDPLTYQRQALGAAIAQQKYANHFFANSAIPAGVITMPVDADKTKAKEAAQLWNARHGNGRSQGTGVLFGGAEYKTISFSPEQAQFLETRRFSREEICGMYGMPLHRIQAVVDHASQGGGKGLEAMDQGYVTHTLMPALLKFERAWTRMIPSRKTYAKFNVAALLRADLSTRYGSYMQGRTGTFLTINEIRALEDMPPIDGGDVLFAPLNSAIAGDSGVVGGAEPTPA